MKERIPLAKGTIFRKRYRIISLLGKGGMGNVYKAFDEKDNAHVALKETFADDDDTRNAFRHEARILENLSHKAFPQVFDFFSDGEGLYLVMELVEGNDLNELLHQRKSAFAVSEVLDWSDQIFHAVEDLHAQGIVHRDIKPSNLILTPEGQIKILDFGIAKGAISDMTTIEATESSIAAASKAYAPIEQVLRADVHSLQLLNVTFSDKTEEILAQGTDGRSDIYALGATLYELLTNSKPVGSPIRALSVWSGQADKLIPADQKNKDIPPFVSGILDKAMAIERDDRFASAQEMRETLIVSKDPINYASLGIECLKIEDYAGAIENCTKAIELNPNYSEAYNNRGIAYTGLGNYEKAIEDYNAAIELDPEFFYAFINRGKLYNDKNKHEQAIKDYSRAIELNPNNAVAYYNRGNAYSNERKYEQAINDYSRAIELNPDYELAYNNRKLAYSEIGTSQKDASQ